MARAYVPVSNLAILETSEARAMGFSALEAICRTLHCQRGDIAEPTQATIVTTELHLAEANKLALGYRCLAQYTTWWD